MSDSLSHLEALFQRIAGIDHATTFLSWDQMVMMPDQGVERRSDALAELAGIRHEMLTAANVGDWIASAEASADGDEQSAMIREMRLVQERESCLPADLVKAQIRAGAVCEHGWRTQRPNNDWSGFLVNFRPVLALAREEATIRQETGAGRFLTPYESLLDLHCTGDSAELLVSVFATLREAIPEMIQLVMGQQPTDKNFYSGEFPVAAQKSLNHTLMQTLGFDFSAGRLDVSAHPFSTGGPGDQRITTRFIDSGITDALLATAHETGHASYEGNLPAKWSGQPLGASRNMCIHESQSLLFEKQIFKSRSFFTHFCSVMTSAFPDNIHGSADELWTSLVQVKPGYIRVDADEVTYPMHVLLRYEIEQALINGDLEAEEIPAAWEEKMQAYLGLSVNGEHNLGCLQDIHWTDGAFGYFPSYTLGAVNAAQLFATLKSRHTDWQERFASGDTGFVRQWLQDVIWQQGCFRSSQELMQNATGEGSNASYLLEHLRARYLQRAY